MYRPIYKSTFRSLQVEEENLKARREQLRYKEEGLKDIEKRYEERLQNEIIKYLLKSNICIDNLSDGRGFKHCFKFGNSILINYVKLSYF